MIWTSIPAMIVFDIVIIGGFAAMLLYAWPPVAPGNDRPLQTGRPLIIGGLSLTAFFYLGDLLIMVAGPAVVGSEKAMLAMTFMHLEMRWPVLLASVFLIGFGVVVDIRQQRGLDARTSTAESQAEAAQQNLTAAEKRFRLLADMTPEAVYCFEFDPPVSVSASIDELVRHNLNARLVECNQVFAEFNGLSTPVEAVGIKVSDLEWTRHKSAHKALMRAFADNDFALRDYEIKYENESGDQRILRIALTGEVQDGRLFRLWGSHRDVLARHRTRAELAGRLHYQRFVADISTRLLRTGSAGDDDGITTSLAMAARHVAADRATIAWLNQTKQAAKVRYVWDRHGRRPWFTISHDDIPWIWPKLLKGEPVAISNNKPLKMTSRPDAEFMSGIGIDTVALIPMMIGDEVSGVIGFSTFSDDREWSEQDMSDLLVLANLFATAIVKIDSQRQLDQALTELHAAKKRLEAENLYLREEVSSSHGFDEIVGESALLVRCLALVDKVARTDTEVLLQGETGTGKELIARAIHDRSDRSDQPMVKVNCAALPANLIESELFGHEKGAFTGATSRKPGRFELANGGTLFLDEIADLPLELQGKLLRVLQEREYQRVGGSEALVADVRLVSATNRPLRQAVEDGDFRSDLYYRVSTFPIALPPLREREGDIILLANHFVRKHAGALGKTIHSISARMMEKLEDYAWPGNVRELEGVIQRALISSPGPVLDLANGLGSPGRPVAASDADEASLPRSLHDAERQHIERILRQCNGKIAGASGAAAALELPESTLRSKMKRLRLS